MLSFTVTSAALIQDEQRFRDRALRQQGLGGSSQFLERTKQHDDFALVQT